MVVHFLVLAGRAQLRAFLRLGEAAVEKAVLVPRHAAELRPVQGVRHRRHCLQVPQGDVLPVATGFLHAHRHVAVVLAGTHQTDARGARRVHRVRVDEDLVLPVQAGAYVDHALVLQAAVLGAEKEVAHFPRRTLLRKVQDVLIPLGYRVPEGDVRQIGLRHRVLALHPVGRLGAGVVLQPAVGVGHLRAEKVVHHGGVLAGFRVGDLLHGLFGGFGGSAAGCEQQDGDGQCFVHGVGNGRGQK